MVSYDDRPYCFICDTRIEKKEWPAHQEHVISAQATNGIRVLAENCARYENALRWIAWQAALHYHGSAFEPIHMRSLSEMASTALEDDDDRDPLPDFTKTMEKAYANAEQNWKDLGFPNEEPEE